MTKDFMIRTTKPREVVDITDRIEEFVTSRAVASGVVSVFVAHTTCCVTTADLDPGTDEDLLDAIEAMIPKLAYRHPHDPSHTGEHIMSSIIGPSVQVPIRDSRLLLGTWQRIVLVELSGPRDRSVYISTP